MRTDYAVFSKLSTKEINRHNAVTGLGGSIQRNPSFGIDGGHVLIVGYADGNNTVTDQGVYNMPDIVTSNLIGDAARDIYIETTKAYVNWVWCSCNRYK